MNVSIEKQLKQLKELIEKKNKCYLNGQLLDEVSFSIKEKESFVRKLKSLEKRDAEIVKSFVKGKVHNHKSGNKKETIIDYSLHYQHFIRKATSFIVEEHVQQRSASFDGKRLIDDIEIIPEVENVDYVLTRAEGNGLEQNWFYDRREAVRYAERWWNTRNPAYRSFHDNCTNYISQCLRAGGAPMTGQPNRSKGWWYTDESWSYSWAVAHSFRWNLSGANFGLRGKEVEKATDLFVGDVICYDFAGDGRWDHTTIVVSKDNDGMPLVNANTSDSRMRYWTYEDSTAWTPNIQYKFFQIVDSTS